MTEHARPINECILMAPKELGLETRVSFQRAALGELERLPDGTGRLVLDLSTTDMLNSAGLTTLMLIQRRAASRRQAVCLRGARRDVRYLLALTKLDDLFEIDSTAAPNGGATGDNSTAPKGA